MSHPLLSSWAALLPAAFMLSGCNQISELISSRVDWSSRAQLSGAFAQEFEVFYEGNPLPRATVESDCKPYLKYFEQVNFEQTRARLADLRAHHGDDCRKWMYEYIDTDRDGRTDWYWNSDQDQFQAFDNDIDGDDVENLVDADPYDASVRNSDSDRNGIPDHLETHAPMPTTERMQRQIEAKNE